MLSKIASKTIEAGRMHAANALTGDETIPEAAGGTVEDLLSGSKSSSKKARTKSGAKSASDRSPARRKASGKKKATAKKPAPRKKMARKKAKSR
jgi:hypothetical protein